MKNELGKSPALVDTNVLVYAYAEISSDKQKAVELLSDCFSGKTTLAISLQNIGEFCDVALRKYRLPHTIVQRISNHILLCQTFVKVPYTGNTLVSAVALSAASKLEFWDAALLATMKENGIDTIYTEDECFNKVIGIKVINPF